MTSFCPVETVLKLPSTCFLAVFRKYPATIERSSGEVSAPLDFISIPSPTASLDSCLKMSAALAIARRLMLLVAHHSLRRFAAHAWKAQKTASSVTWSPSLRAYCSRPRCFLSRDPAGVPAIDALDCCWNTLSVVSIDSTEMVSSVHPSSAAEMIALAAMGSRGNLDIFLPTALSAPSLSSAPRANSSSSARTSDSLGGASINGNPMMSTTPMALSCSTTPPRLVRSSSGVTCGSRLCTASSQYSRKHLPGPSRPARPALCVAWLTATGATSSSSTPLLG
mmetsp:Transcript_17827/g.44154  ORF Transcript_17827/g.44154 Transcript_17827/m.44154 type:complete len:280 (-) Transcript_17827:1102-1941(-)